MKTSPANGSARSACCTRAASPSMPLRKSTGRAAKRMRTPGGTAITSGPAPPRALADSGAKRNGLSEADLDVPAKLREQRLERGEEAEALARRQVVREHDLLQLGVAQRVEVEVPRQVAPQPAVGVLHRPFLPGGVRVAEPGGHRAGAREQAVPGELGVVVEGDRRPQRYRHVG